MTQSSTNEITSLYGRKNKVKQSPNILDKASRYFDKEIAHRYGYKIIKLIDVNGLRIVIAEDANNKLYSISLVIVTKGNNLIKEQDIPLSRIIKTTRLVARKYNAIASSSFVEID